MSMTEQEHKEILKEIEEEQIKELIQELKEQRESYELEERE